MKEGSVQYSPNKEAGLVGKTKNKVVGGAVWVAEKSTYVTLPATAVIVAFTPLTLIAAAPFMAADAGGFVLFRGIRNRRKKQGK